MSLTQRTAIRAALRIHERLVHCQNRSTTCVLPTRYWEQACTLHRQLEHARDRGWLQAASQLTDDLLSPLCYLASDIESLVNALRELNAETTILGPGQIYEELRALEHEFEEVSCDLRAEVLGITTPPVILEDISFGPFEIRLDWSQFDKSPAYAVVALEPNHPQSRSDITHPHVQDDHLCEGDAAQALRKALLSGRLSDFFQIVNQTLGTYNGSSPYVKLSRWSESMGSCNDCDTDLDLDDACGCYRCDATLCESCSMSCEQCNERTCSSCSRYCAGCTCPVCRDCQLTCSACSELFCEGCLDEGMCKQCREDRTVPDDPEPAEADEASTPAPVQPDGVGQTVISA